MSYVLQLRDAQAFYVYACEHRCIAAERWAESEPGPHERASAYAPKQLALKLASREAAMRNDLDGARCHARAVELVLGPSPELPAFRVHR